MKKTLLAGAAVALLAALSLTLAAAERESAHARDAAAGAAGHPAVALDAWARGDVVDVLWAAPRRGEGESGYDLFHARSLDGGRAFGPAVQIGAGWASVHNPHRGTDPQIAAHGDRVVAVWTAPGTSSWGSGPLAVALSGDGGRTWSRGPNPADDGSTEGHGFIDVAATSAGVFHAVWLDGRDGYQGLRVARSEDGGASWRPNASIDARTCECCWNDLTVLGGERLAVLYRDHDPRDMAVAVSEDDGRSWSRRGVAGEFDWEVEGCPHVGGGLAARRGSGAGAAERPEIHALVWTGAADRAGLYAVASRDGGRRWSEARALGSPRAKHGDLAAGGAVVYAAWDDGGTISAATSSDGTTWGAPRQLSRDGAAATHPVVVAVESGAVVLWTETVDGADATRWVAARIGPGGRALD
jgi:hypothetical protein